MENYREQAQARSSYLTDTSSSQQAQLLSFQPGSEENGSQLEHAGAAREVPGGRKRRGRKPTQTPEEKRVKKIEADRNYRKNHKDEFDKLKATASRVENMEAELQRLRGIEQEYHLLLHSLEQMKDKFGGIEEMESKFYGFEQITSVFGGIDGTLKARVEKMEAELQRLRRIEQEYHVLCHRLEQMKDKFGGIEEMESMLHGFEQITSMFGGIDGTLKARVEKMEAELQRLRGIEQDYQVLRHRLEQMKDKFGGIDETLTKINRLKNMEFHDSKNKQMEMVSRLNHPNAQPFVDFLQYFASNNVSPCTILYELQKLNCHGMQSASFEKQEQGSEPPIDMDSIWARFSEDDDMDGEENEFDGHEDESDSEEDEVFRLLSPLDLGFEL